MQCINYSAKALTQIPLVPVPYCFSKSCPFIPLCGDNLFSLISSLLYLPLNAAITFMRDHEQSPIERDSTYFQIFFYLTDPEVCLTILWMGCCHSWHFKAWND